MKIDDKVQPGIVAAALQTLGRNPFKDLGNAMTELGKLAMARQKMMARYAQPTAHTVRHPARPASRASRPPAAPSAPSAPRGLDALNAQIQAYRDQPAKPFAPVYPAGD